MNELLGLSISEIHKKLVKKEVSAEDLTRWYLDRINEQEKDLNAFITMSSELALAQARAIDGKIARNEKISLLGGIPCSLKDAILLEGERCTAGSKMLESYVAPYDATVTRRLKEEGAVIMGKTNMDEFSMGASTENSAFGPTKNPFDRERVAGGSSGGSAASVAAGECVFSLGEDTGGSIRLPASFCGVVGLKPTYGAISRYGVIALASSLDQIGPFAKSVEDAEIVFASISGKDPLDSTSVDYSYQVQSGKDDLREVRIGIPREYFAEGIDPRVEEIVKNSLRKLEAAGAMLEEISLPHTPFALASYYVINTSEASANLARYDGIRYGYRKVQSETSERKSAEPQAQNENSKNQSLLETYLSNRGEGFGSEVKRRIMLGTYALSAGYYEAYYGKAQKIRSLLRQDFEKAFEKVDLIAGPVSPFLPFPIGERTENPLAMYLVDVYTVPVNLAGLPGISIPAGKVGHLPVGLQMIARHFQESFLFEVGKIFERL